MPVLATHANLTGERRPGVETGRPLSLDERGDGDGTPGALVMVGWVEGDSLLRRFS